MPLTLALKVRGEQVDPKQAGIQQSRVNGRDVALTCRRRLKVWQKTTQSRKSKGVALHPPFLRGVKRMIMINDFFPFCVILLLYITMVYLWVIRRVKLNNPIHFWYIQSPSCHISAQQCARTGITKLKKCCSTFLLLLLPLEDKKSLSLFLGYYLQQQ